METILELKERLNECVKTAFDIQEKADAESRDVSPVEAETIQHMLGEHDELKVEIQRRERMAEAKAGLEKAERKSEPQEPGTPEVEKRTPRVQFSRFRHGALRAFQPAKGETQIQAEERAYRAGMWVAATVYNSQRASLWCREHGVELRAQAEGTNAYGGSIVPIEMESAIIDLRERYGVFRANAKVQPMTRDHMVIPRRVSGVTIYAVGEAAEITESEKTWDQVALTAKKWAGLIRISSELNEDAIISVGDDLAGELALAFATKEDDCAFNGTGASTYHGIMGILPKMLDGNHAYSYITAPGAGNSMDIFSEVTVGALGSVAGTLPNYAQVGAKWFCPKAAVEEVFARLAYAQGGATAAELMRGGANAQFMGYPVVGVSNWTGTSSTDFSGAVMLFLANMQLAATLGDRRGTTIKVTSDRYIEYDQLGIVGTTRWDINIHDIGGTATRGPLVGLLGN